MLETDKNTEEKQGVRVEEVVRWGNIFISIAIQHITSNLGA